jgi:sugar lactone lactonase YvrE
MVTHYFTLDKLGRADTVRHLLVVLTADGKLLESTRGGEIKLRYPNGIAIANSETLAVADSNNFRILTWSTNPLGIELTPDRQVDFVRNPKSKNPYISESQKRAIPVADEGRIYPVFVEFDDRGFWWVLVGDGNFARDNLLRFDRNWENPPKIPLPGNPDISDMAVSEDRVLLTVPEAY